jgi:large repetitive protein
VLRNPNQLRLLRPHVFGVLILMATLVRGFALGPLFVVQPTGKTVLVDDEVTLTSLATGVPPVAYQWRKESANISGATNSSYTIAHANTNDTARYRVVATDITGSTSSSYASVDVIEPPTITAQPQSQTVPAGTNVSFTVNAGGTPPVTFQWYRGTTLLAGRTSQTLTISPVALADAGTYSVVVSNLGGAVRSDDATLTVTMPPLILNPPQDQSVIAGSSAGWNVQVQGSQPMTLQWFFEGAPLAGATNATLAFPVARPRNAGNYLLTASNAYGVVITDPAQLQVDLVPLTWADNFVNATPFSGSYLAAHISNIGATREVDEPRHDDKRSGHSVWAKWTAPATGIVTINTAGSDFDTLVGVYTGSSLSGLQRVESDDDSGPLNTSLLKFNAIAGTTYYIALDGYGLEQGAAVFEFELVATEDLLPRFIRHPQSVAVLPGADVDLTFEYAVDSGVVEATINWLFKTTLLATATATNSLRNITDDLVGTYRARLVTPTHTVLSRAADIQINYQGRTNVFAKNKLGDAIDFGQFTLTETAQGQTKSGTKSGTSTRGYSSTQIFSTVGGTSDPGEPVACGAGGGHTSWYAYQAETNGTLKIDTDGSNFDTVLAVYIGPGDSYATLTNVACDNNSGQGGSNSMVRFNATAGVIYYIQVDGISNQVGTVKLHLNLGNPVSVVTNPLSQSVSSGANASFSIAAGGMTNYAYQWRFNGASLSGQTNVTLMRSNVNPAHGGSYDVVVNNPINSTTSQVATLTVISSTLSITNQPQNQTVLAGNTALFSVGASGSGSLIYQWRWNATAMNGATNATLSISNAQTTNAGNYDVVIIDANGSRTSSNAVLTVNAPPNITLQPVSRTVSAGGTVTLTSAASGSPAPSLQWFFNNSPLAGANSSSLLLTNIQAAQEGSYSMRATNMVGSVFSSSAALLLNSTLRLTNMVRSSNATTMRVIGEANANHVIEGTTNFTNWTKLATNAPETGIWIFSDSSSNNTTRFYRVLKL